VTTDELVDEIFGRCRERIERGEDVDVGEVLRVHPDLAGALRERFAAVRLLDRAGVRRRRDDFAATRVGTSLGGYRLEAVLGAGGMGTVYLASAEAASEAVAAGERVAVKVFHPHLAARERFTARFLREADLGRRVRHANVVRTLDAGEAVESDRPVRFLVMEHVEGRTLREVLDELGRLPEELVRHVGRETARGLAAIHAAGAVHRDLKPENVIVTNEHVVKVMDLGVARLDDAATLSEPGAFIGSLRYGAPEQVRRNGEIDARADLHALGLLLHELATGERPFDGEDFGEVVRQILDVRPRPIGELAPQVSPFLEELVAQLVEKDRERRPARADAVASILAEGESSAWWKERAAAMRRETRRPLRRIRVPRETALYGRDAELARLRSLYELAKAGQGQTVLVEGEAGIGKSRLVDEFVSSLWAEREELDFVFGSYPPGGAASAAGAFATAYREHFGDDETAIREALPRTPALAASFAALLRGDAVPAGAEKLTKDSIQTLFVDATRSLAARRTTIVLIDDLHFAPEEGRALFTSVALAAPGHRVLLVGGARRSLDEKWAATLARLPGVARLPLARLGAKDLVDLLADALRSRHLGEELAGRIAAKSDGNPFFVFEILRGLREGQFLTRKPDGTWITTRSIREIDVPPSIVGVIQARVSDLDEDERDVLEAASCAGFEFDASLVGAVLRVEPIPLLQRLGRIEKGHRLVRSVGHLFAFDHHKVQEVLYAGLSPPLREAYHAAIAEAIEARRGLAAGDAPLADGALCVELADHFLRGARGERALRYLEAALVHLESRWLHDAAQQLCERALASPGLVGGPARAELLMRRAARLSELGRTAEVAAPLEEARAQADGTGSAALRMRVRHAQAQHLVVVSAFADAEAAVRDAFEIARASGESDSALRATFAQILRDQGRLDEARRELESLLERAARDGDAETERRASSELGTTFLWESRFADAGRVFTRLLEAERRGGDRRGIAAVTGQLGVVCMAEGRMEDALERFSDALQVMREVGFRRGEVTWTGNLGNALNDLGRHAEALPLYERALALARDIGSRVLEGYWLHALGNVADEQRRDADAEALLRAAIVVRREIGHRFGEAHSRLFLGQLLARVGRTGESAAELREACEIARTSGLPDIEVSALAALAAHGGDVAAAESAFARHGGSVALSTSIDARMDLFRATGKTAYVAEAKAIADRFLALNPGHRERMMALHLHRDVADAAVRCGLA
jgi:serine/threonine protein kinase/tetratricopeptide (TPR) repeat protein